jgi:hypothetical protein
VVRRPVRHPEGGRRREVPAVGHARRLGGGEYGALGERAVEDRTEHPVAFLQVDDARADGEHLAGQLAARHERYGHGDLVLVGDQQRVREVGGRCMHLNEDFAGPWHRVGELLNREVFRRPVAAADESAHPLIPGSS